MASRPVPRDMGSTITKTKRTIWMARFSSPALASTMMAYFGTLKVQRKSSEPSAWRKVSNQSLILLRKSMVLAVFEAR